MSAYLSLGGQQAYEANVLIPFYGAWIADVKLAETPTALMGNQSLVIGTMTLMGNIYRGGAFAGEFSARMTAGYGGWSTNIGSQAYQNPTGIMASTILQDAAATVGEQITVGADYSVGTNFVREGGNPPTTAYVPAGKLLRQLASLWWIDLTGMTQVQQARTTMAIMSDFQIEEYDHGKGLFRITTENPQDWMPGNTFSNINMPTAVTISSTRIHCKDNGEMHLTVLSHRLEGGAGT